jgi:cytidine deaminase
MNHIDYKSLVAAAKRASESAYAPYSRFSVGAAVLADDGSIFSGGNVENASYGLTVCAERVATFKAVASGIRRIHAVVVYTPTSHPTAPCGACRQVLFEFGPDARVLAACESGETMEWSVNELLPDAFGPSNLDGH